MAKERYHYPTTSLGSEELELIRQLAGRHDVGRTALLGVDRDKYPFQGSYRLDGQKLNYRQLWGLAEQLEPRFTEVKHGLNGEARMDRIGELLDGGKNVAITLPHGPLTDIGVTGAAVRLKLEDRNNANLRTGILVSQTLQMLALKFNDAEFPAAEALGFLCDRVYFSVPRTRRVQESELAHPGIRDSIAAHNRSMLKDLTEDMDTGGLLLIMAPSGTTDAYEDGTHKLAPLTRGTIQLMKHPKLYIQPLATKLSGTDPFIFELAGEPTKVETDADAHRTMHNLAAALNDNLPDQNYIYLDPRRAE